MFSLALLPLVVAPPAFAQSGATTFEDVAPIFAKHCLLCHNGAAAPLGLRLDTHNNVINGSSNGPVVIEGDSAGSELIRRVKGESMPRMPMTGPPFLSDEEVSVLERWVDAGMPQAAQTVAAPEPVQPTVAERLASSEPVTYTSVAPIFATRCAKCHTDDGLMGPPPEGFRLTSHAATVAIDDRVRVVPGHPDASELMRRIRGQALPRMPFDGPPYLSADEIALIDRWIAEGARDSEGRLAALPVGAKIRLDGRLTGRWDLDGLPLTVSRSTRIDKSPGVGDYVEVRGRVGADGEVFVERLRRR